MCKFYGHGIDCPFKTNNKKCNHIHDEKVREAYCLARDTRQMNKPATRKEIEAVLVSNTEKEQDLLMARKKLFETYPKEPTPMEMEFAERLLS